MQQIETSSLWFDHFFSWQFPVSDLTKGQGCKDPNSISEIQNGGFLGYTDIPIYPPTTDYTDIATHN